RTQFGASRIEGPPRRVHQVRRVRALDRPHRQEPLRRQDRAEGDVVKEPDAVGAGPRLKSPDTGSPKWQSRYRVNNGRGSRSSVPWSGARPKTSQSWRTKPG